MNALLWSLFEEILYKSCNKTDYQWVFFKHLLSLISDIGIPHISIKYRYSSFPLNSFSDMFKCFPIYVQFWCVMTVRTCFSSQVKFCISVVGVCVCAKISDTSHPFREEAMHPQVLGNPKSFCSDPLQGAWRQLNSNGTVSNPPFLSMRSCVVVFQEE